MSNACISQVHFSHRLTVYTIVYTEYSNQLPSTLDITATWQINYGLLSLYIDWGYPTNSGCEITKNYLVSFRKLTPKIWVSESLSGFPSGSQIHLESLALIFTGCPSGNPCKIIGFPAVFLGVPDTRKLSNFAPCNLFDFHDVFFKVSIWYLLFPAFWQEKLHHILISRVCFNFW